MAATSSPLNSECNNVCAQDSCLDRISNLPDLLLSQILSLLPTKYAVATSILSRAWRFPWTSISNLDFDDSLLISTDDERKKSSFMHFLSRVLLLLNPQRIHKFRLTCSYNVCDSVQVSEWIHAALAHDTEELVLYIPLSGEIPLSLFTCKTIVVLKLNGAHITFKFPADDSVCFPNLKILHLINVNYIIDVSASIHSAESVFIPNISIKFTSNESVCKHLLSCPVLEDLVIERNRTDNVLTFGIYAPALRSLKYNSRCIGFANPIPMCKIRINCPELEHLTLLIDDGHEILMEILPALLKAEIDFALDDLFVLDHSDCGHRAGVLRLLNGVFHTKFLSLSLHSLEVLSYASEYVAPMLHNVARLELSFNCIGWYLIPMVLENSNNLEHLGCNEGSTMYLSSQLSRWTRPSCVPRCLLSCLSTVQISYFSSSVASTDKLSLASYILENAKVLKNMTIRTRCSDLNSRFELHKRL